MVLNHIAFHKKKKKSFNYFWQKNSFSEKTFSDAIRANKHLHICSAAHTQMCNPNLERRKLICHTENI